MSWFKRRDKPPTTGPSGPHRFVEPADSRLGLAVSASQPNLQMGPAMSVAEASLRPVLCAMGGCGKPREDAIHQLDD